MKDTKTNQKEIKVIELTKFPENIIDIDGKNKRFDAKKVSEFQKQQLAMLDLKVTALFEPRVEVRENQLVLVGLCYFEDGQEEELKNIYREKLRRALKIADLVYTNTRPDNDFQIIVPGMVHKDEDRDPSLVPEIRQDGLHLRTDSEYQQILALEKGLKKGSITIGDKLYESEMGASSPFLINEVTDTTLDLNLVYSHHSAKNEIFVDVYKSKAESQRKSKKKSKPIKLNFHEDFLKDTSYLKLIQHSTYKEKTVFTVEAVVSKVYDMHEDRHFTRSITVSKILNDGFKKYEPDALKIWDDVA